MPEISASTDPESSLPPLPQKRIIRGHIGSTFANTDLAEAAIESFEIIGILGEGGMGVVYRAHQPKLKRQIALKLLRTERSGPRGILRFEREVEILARLRHPGIAQLYSVGTTVAAAGGRVPYMAMELVEGLPLSQGASRLNLRQKVQLAIKICDAVAYAHSQGVLHRDLKPANILIEEGQPKILDFGVGMLAGRTNSQFYTEAGHVVGTFEYMSPEQAAGTRHITAATDVYALGVTFYELFSCERLFDFSSMTTGEALKIKQEREPQPLSRFGRVLGGDLTTIIAKATAKDLAQRYDTVTALGDDLRHLLNHEPIVARAPTWTYRSRKFLRRNRFWVSSAAAVFVALSVGLLLALISAHDAKNWANRAEISLGEAKVAQADALFSAGRYVEARPLYDDAWSIFEQHGVSTWPAQLGIWEVDQKCDRPVRVLDPTGHDLNGIALTRDGKFLALGHHDGRLEMQEMAAGRTLWQIKVGEDVSTLYFTPDGRYLGVASGRGDRIIDTASGELIRQDQLPLESTFATASSRGFYFAKDRKSLWFVPIDKDRLAKNVDLPVSWMVGLQADAEDNLCVAGREGTVLIRKAGATDFTSIGTLLENVERGVFIGDDLKWLAVQRADGITVRGIPGLELEQDLTGSFRVVRSLISSELAYYDPATHFLLSRDRRGILRRAIPVNSDPVGALAGDVTVVHDGINPTYIWSAAGRTGELTGPDYVAGTSAISADGLIVATATPDIVMWNKQSGAILDKLACKGPIKTLRVDSTGRTVLALNDYGDLMIGDLSRPSPHRLTLLASNIQDADLSDNADVIVSCKRGTGGASVWYRTGEKWEPTEFVPNALVAAVRIEPGGHAAALGFADRTQEWSLEGPPKLTNAFGVGFVVSRMAQFLNPADLVVAHGEDLFTLTNRGQRLLGHANVPLRSVAAGSNGLVAAISEDHSVWIYEDDTSPGLLRHMAAFNLATVASMDRTGNWLIASASRTEPLVIDFQMPAEPRKNAHP